MMTYLTIFVSIAPNRLRLDQETLDEFLDFVFEVMAAAVR
jgi:hypothetical protein